jgi:hypothetical protein
MYVCMCVLRMLAQRLTLCRACAYYRIQADEEHEMDVFAIVFEIISVSPESRPLDAPIPKLYHSTCIM